MTHKFILTVISAVVLTLSANQRLAAQTTTPPSLTGSWQLTLSPTSPADNVVANNIEVLLPLLRMAL